MKLSRKQKESLEKVFEKEGVGFAYLFGSQATGKTNRESDYDIAVYISSKLSEEKLFQKRLKLIAEVSKIIKSDNLDLVILNTVRSPFFRFVIIKEGDLIFEKDIEARIDLELKIIQEYEDYKPIMEMYNKRLLTNKL